MIEPASESLATSLADLADRLADRLDQLLATRIGCLGCTAEAHKATASGQEPPPINFVDVIVNGCGQCWAHVQFVDRPLAPGQLPSGLLLPGSGA
jgi:hypothetical protein